MTLEQERWLVATTFARADLWVTLWDRHEPDTFRRSVVEVLQASTRGFQRLAAHVWNSSRQGYRSGRRAEDPA